MLPDSFGCKRQNFQPGLTWYLSHKVVLRLRSEHAYNHGYLCPSFYISRWHRAFFFTIIMLPLVGGSCKKILDLRKYKYTMKGTPYI